MARTHLSSLEWRVFDDEDNLVAATLHVEDAARIVDSIGSDGTIRTPFGRVVWTEGVDGDAGDSYEYVAKVAYKRLVELNRLRRTPRRGNA